MDYFSTGKILCGVGGLYTIKVYENKNTPTPLDNQTVICRARGNFRHANISPLPGDDVKISYRESSFHMQDGRTVPDADGTDIRIDEILPRNNALIRPPMANLDTLFVCVATAAPQPIFSTIDKLISIAEHNGVEPVILISKSDLAPVTAKRLHDIYTHAGFSVFPVSCLHMEGIEEVRNYIQTSLPGKTAAFAGASGVGKSTLLNHLFPILKQLTGEISKKNERGKNTTREVTLFPLSELTNFAISGGYLADTPGFSLLDFTRFDFFDKEDLPLTMREFAPYLTNCRYTGCTHTKDEGCAILEALHRGNIEQTRFDSFLSMYEELKDKHAWDKK